MGTILGFFSFFNYLLLILTCFPFAISVQKIYFYICNKFVIKNEKYVFSGIISVMNNM